MSGRPRLESGSHGEISVKALGNGKWRARVVVRGNNGIRREVTAWADTKSGARRALERKLKTHRPIKPMGVHASMTVDQLGEYWIQRRERQGREPKARKIPTQRGRGRRTTPALKPQTLAAYATVLRLIIRPALGQLLLSELSVGRLDQILGDLEDSGISTAQARSVLHQMFALAVRHEAIPSNPMDLVEPLSREDNEVEALDVDEVRLLRHAVLPETRKRPGCRGPNRDLAEVIDVALGTGCRIGEVLSLQWKHLDLDGPAPTALVNGTLIEPRGTYVAKLHRQEHTKGRDVRRLILPDHVVELLRRRRERSKHAGPNDPVFASRNGTWLWPNNIRTRLREAIDGIEQLKGTTPHTLRRTVGTLITHNVSLDAARAQLGHALPGVTGRHYVARREVAPDLREELDAFFSSTTSVDAALDSSNLPAEGEINDSAA